MPIRTELVSQNHVFIFETNDNVQLSAPKITVKRNKSYVDSEADTHNRLFYSYEPYSDGKQ
jgi:hypothetical protein